MVLSIVQTSNQVSAKLKLNGTLRTGSPWFDVLDSFIAFICAFAALPAADLSNSSCLQVEENESQSGSSQSKVSSKSTPSPGCRTPCGLLYRLQWLHL